jgi:hypothetical protein
MRIAVLFYGRINKAEDTYKNIVDAIGAENTVDYFLSTGEQSVEQLNTFISLYNPIAYTNEEIHYTYDIPSNSVQPAANCNQHNIICSFINKQRAYRLLEAHIEKSKADYNIVFSLRCDIVFQGKIQYLTIEDDTVYIPKSCKGFTYVDFISRLPTFSRPLKGITDTMAYGNPSVMKKYSNIVDNMIHLLNTGNCWMHPETINYSNIMHNNLEIERFYTDFDIVR